MNFTKKKCTKREFKKVIKKSPPIFDEILAKLVSERDLTENDVKLLKNDVLYTVLVVIMIENGFRLKVRDGELLEDAGDIDYGRLVNWKLPSGLYETEFMLGLCEISTKLIMVPLATAVLVNVVLNGIESEIYSVCLPIDQYIVLTRHETTVAKLFRNLQLLSDTFKNKVITPIKSKLLGLCGYPGASLVGLPENLFLKIMLYLRTPDIISICKTCATFKHWLDNNNFWRKLFLRDYIFKRLRDDYRWYVLFRKNYKTNDVNDNDDWKSLYKEYYVECQKEKLSAVQIYSTNVLSLLVNLNLINPGGRGVLQ